MLRDVMGGIELARHLQHQEPGGGARHATAARVSYMTRRPASHHESADAYRDIVARLGPRHRVIIYKDQLQWILQRRDGQRHGRARWAGVGYCMTREALLRASRASCARIDPAALAALAALPEHIGRPST